MTDVAIFLLATLGVIQSLAIIDLRRALYDLRKDLLVERNRENAFRHACPSDSDSGWSISGNYSPHTGTVSVGANNDR